ncbi:MULTISPECIES: alpha/beta hydrolase [unclassified Mycobacterium]|uniref:alpha/beta hydrolase n=1 Tax=unclassified Mycobacterium TaxID=2642494 RepID=UPI0021B3A136|nr:alpha/beta hydrolase [Mycobacterium sp. SMC-8]
MTAPRDIAPALARLGRRVYVFDYPGNGQSEKHERQDLTLAAQQGRNFAELLRQWGLDRHSLVACDIGGATVLRALLLENSAYSDVFQFDAVTGGGTWEHGLFGLIRQHHEVFEQLPAYTHPRSTRHRAPAQRHPRRVPPRRPCDIPGPVVG